MRLEEQLMEEEGWSEAGGTAHVRTAHSTTTCGHAGPAVPALPRPWHEWPCSHGGHSLLRTANSSSEGFRSGLRFGSSFFMVLGLLLRS